MGLTDCKLNDGFDLFTAHPSLKILLHGLLSLLRMTRPSVSGPGIHGSCESLLLVEEILHESIVYR